MGKGLERALESLVCCAQVNNGVHSGPLSGFIHSEFVHSKFIHSGFTHSGSHTQGLEHSGHTLRVTHSGPRTITVHTLRASPASTPATGLCDSEEALQGHHREVPQYRPTLHPHPTPASPAGNAHSSLSFQPYSIVIFLPKESGNQVTIPDFIFYKIRLWGKGREWEGG